jgi:hypothetical protein
MRKHDLIATTLVLIVAILLLMSSLIKYFGDDALNAGNTVPGSVSLR